MYFIPYLFNHVYIFIGCIDFSSWLGLPCIVLFLILTVHSYVAPTLNKFIYLFIYTIKIPKRYFYDIITNELHEYTLNIHILLH